MYWNRHASTYEKSHTGYKYYMKKLIISFTDKIMEKIETQTIPPNGLYTTFSEVKWTKKIEKRSSQLLIRTSRAYIDVWPGEATMWQFPEYNPWSKSETPAGRSRKRSAVKIQDPSYSSSGSEEEVVISTRALAREPVGKRKVQVRRPPKRSTVSAVKTGKQVGDIYPLSGSRRNRRHPFATQPQPDFARFQEIENARLQEIKNLRQSLQAATQESELRKQQNQQLEKAVQQIEGEKNQEIQSLKSTVDRLQNELRRKNSLIHNLSHRTQFGRAGGLPPADLDSDWV